MLFDLGSDIGEQRDCAKEQPQRAAELRALYDAWASQLAQPRWGGSAVVDGGDAGK